MLGIVDTLGGSLMRLRTTRWAVILLDKEKAARLPSETRFVPEERPNFVADEERDHLAATFGDAYIEKQPAKSE